MGISLAYALLHLPFLRRWIPARDHACSAQVAFRFNSFIGLAIAKRLAGPQGGQLIAVLISVCVRMFNVGGKPLIIGTASGLIADLASLSIAQWLEPNVTRIGAVSVALELLATGASMQLGALGRASLPLALGVLS